MKETEIINKGKNSLYGILQWMVDTDDSTVNILEEYQRLHIVNKEHKQGK